MRKDHLLQHQKLHDQHEELPCDICGKPFSRADHLAKHKAAKHGIGEKVTVSTVFIHVSIIFFSIQGESTCAVFS